MPEADYWSSRRVTVTGGCGFLGAHLTRVLVLAGADVTVLDNHSHGHNHVTADGKIVTGYTTSIDDVTPGLCYWWCDCGEQDQLRHTLACCKPDILFHLAARVAGVEENRSLPFSMYAANVPMTAAMLQAAVHAHVRRIVLVSSVCVYARGHNSPAVEAEWGPSADLAPANAAYAEAKRDCERMAGWLTREGSGKGPEVVIARPANLYGPCDHFTPIDHAHVIPALIARALHSNPAIPLVVQGTGEERREFLYAPDAAAGLMALAQMGRAGEAYNLGPAHEQAISIHSVASLILAACGQPERRIQFTGGGADTDQTRRTDCTKG